MRILIPTIGSRGDVQPFIALAQGLIDAGHAATLASHPVMQTLVESHGVPFAPIGPNIDLTEEVAAVRRRSRNAAAGLVRAMRFRSTSWSSRKPISSRSAGRPTWWWCPLRARRARTKPSSLACPT